MPVYLRQYNDIPTPTISDIGENDEDDFLQDPDQRWDKLPQPFRFLNKILISVFERAWEIANSREVERITEAAKIRPPQYECASKIKEFGNVASMCSTPDGKFVIFGLTCGIAAVDALTEEPVAIWQHDGVEIVSITCCGFDTEVYMICAIDDMGHGRLFCLASGVLFSVQTMNEEDSGAKSHVNKFEASPKGDFIGIFFENPSTKESWLEVHKTPRDAWTKELETAIAKSAAKQSNNAEHINPKAPSPTEHAEENAGGDNKNQLEDNTGETGETDIHGTDAASQGETKEHLRRISVIDAGHNNTPRGFKFTTTTVVLKVRPPSSVQGVQWSSPFQLSKTVDNGSVIGTGMNHLLSTHHLETRMSVFKALHEQHIKYLPNEEKPVAREPTFHFLAPGRMMPFGMESPHISGETNSVMVWWTNHNQIQHFNLVKPAKEVEHKPDLVWPTSSHIVATAVSRCTSLVAVAVDSGIVTVWDKYIGMKRRSVYVSENIQQLLFLDPSVCPQEESSYPPYTTSTDCYLLVWCKDGRLHLVNCASGCDTPPSDVSVSLDGPDDLYTVIRPVDGIPELMLTCRSNGRIYLHNIVTTDVLCEVVLPSPYEVFNPWQPVTSAGGQGQMLYIRGKLKPNHSTRSEQTSEEENPAEQDGVFVFHLCSFPTLEQYRTRHRPTIPYTVHNTVEARVDALFRERIAQQVSRKARMQDRWNHLKDELELIKQLRNKPSQPKIRTNLFATGQH